MYLACIQNETKGNNSNNHQTVHPSVHMQTHPVASTQSLCSKLTFGGVMYTFGFTLLRKFV